MAALERPGPGPISGINVTPLVDVALVLLVIFIVTAKIVVTPAVPLDLPASAQTEQIQVVLSVIVPVRGPILVDGDAAQDEEAFVAAVSHKAAQHPELRAVIHAEGKTDHARVLAVLDRLRRSGVSRVAFAADPLAEGEG